jgi:streptomycin 6-kinase
VTGHFAATGQLRLGRGTVPDHVYDRRKDEGDLEEGGSFDGHYRELVAVLAEHAAPAEREGKLLFNLPRENDRRAMLHALLMAMVAVSQASLTTQDTDELAERIAVEAAHRYAAPRHAPVSRDISQRLFAWFWPSLFLKSTPSPVRIGSAASALTPRSLGQPPRSTEQR